MFVAKTIFFRMLPWGVIILLIGVWVKQQEIQTTKIVHLESLISLRDSTLLHQADSIDKLQKEIQLNNQLTKRVQHLTEQLQDERHHIKHEIKESIAHESCRTIKLPDNVALRMRQFASATLHP